MSGEFREQKSVPTKEKSLTYSSGTEAGKAGLGPRMVSSYTDIRWKAKPPPCFALNEIVNTEKRHQQQEHKLNSG